MIRYRAGYKYQLVEGFEEAVPELAGHVLEHPYFELRDGVLRIREGYAWDGLTGAFDDRKSLGASLIHDVACQAVQEGLAPFELRTPLGDAAFHRRMVEKGAPRLVAGWRWAAVSLYAHARGGGRTKPILEAP